MFNARALRLRWGTFTRCRRGPAAVMAVIAPTLAGCAADTNPVRDVFVATGVGAKPRPAPDFVVQITA